MRRWMAEGRFRLVREGRTVRIPREELARWIREVAR